MNLISIRNQPLICTICGDVQHSLDNLAAHLIQHIVVVPSQIGNHHKIQCDANNGIQNTINSVPICNDIDVVEQIKVEQNLNGNLTQKFEAPSPLSPSTPSSPPVSSLQSLNIASEPSSSITARSSNDQIVQPFVCNLCNGTFRSKELQRLHMQLVHEINIRPSRENNNNLFENTSATMHQCYWCPKHFKTIGSLRLHVRMVHGVSHVPQIICTPNAFNCETTMSNDDNLMPLSSPSIVAVAEAAAAGNDVKELTKTGDPPIASTSSIAHDVNSNNLPLIHNNQTADYYSNYGLNDTTFGSSSMNNNDGSGSGSGSSSGSGNSSNCGGMIDQKDTDDPYNGNNNNSKEMTITSTDDRIHKCDICNKRFTTKYFLKKHKRLHTGKLNEMILFTATLRGC